jgi:protein CpxP
MKKRILAISAIAVLVIGATVLALGHGFQGHGGPRDGRRHADMLEHMSQALNLTDAQKQQVKAIMDETEAAAEANHTKIEEIHKQLHAATANGQFDETQVRALANQKAQLDADMMVEHFRAMSKVFAILTPEQRTKAEELHKQMERGARHGRPGPPPGF